jgi:Fic family protein
MGRKPYRVEVIYPKHEKPRYYLVKDVKVRGKKRKVSKYLGHNSLSTKEKEQYREDYAYEIEEKAAWKRAELSSSFYKSQYLSFDQVKLTEEIKYLYKTFIDLLTTAEIDVYEGSFEVQYVQGTTSIEGNTLTLRETYDLLVNGITPSAKSLREINEVQNFKKLKMYRDKYRRKVTVDFIKNLHRFVMSNIDTEFAGIFRRVDDIGIVGCDISVTPAILIEPELNSAISEYYTHLIEGWHPFEQTILFHHKFEIIHPFNDGNGRVGREVLNYMLTRVGYPRLLFLGKDRDTYLDSLKMGDHEDYAGMVKAFGDLVVKQRMNVLKENLKKVVHPPKRTGQLRITDFSLEQPVATPAATPAP